MRFLLYGLTAVYATAGIAFHREVGNLAVGRYKNILGDFVPREHSVAASLVLLGLLLIFLVRQLRTGQRIKATLLYWLLYAGVLSLFYLFISLHPVEVIHLVQYSGLACLFGLCIDRSRAHYRLGRILVWTCALGVLDEVIQYCVIFDFQKYMDFGDFVVNVLGAIGGVLLFYGFREAPGARRKPMGSLTRTWEFRTGMLMAVAFAVLWMGGYVDRTPPGMIPPGHKIVRIAQRPVFFLERLPGYLGSWQPHFVAGRYYALAPLEGILLTLALPLFFATFDPRFPRPRRS